MIVDRLSLVSTIDDPKIGHNTYCQLMEHQGYVGVFGYDSVKFTGGYNFAKRLELPDLHKSEARPIFQARIDKKNKRVERIRFEMVPADLGPEGIHWFKVFVDSKLHYQGWPDFLKRATIGRIDIAVDFEHSSLAEFHVLPPIKVMKQCWSRDGILRTVVWGKSGGKQLSLYDRKDKRAQKNQYGEQYNSCRLEARLFNVGGRKLLDIKNLANPFKGVKIFQTLPSKPATAKNSDWEMFCDSVAQRELDNALALLPAAKKLRYRKHILAHQSPEWKPDELWTEWGSVIDELGIIDPKL